MKIEVYALMHNEERMLPYFMRHYSQFADVILHENNSTDRSVKLAKELGAKVVIEDVPDEIDDQWYINVKNHCWMGSKAEWVMVVDIDEFIYHPSIVKCLKKIKATIVQPQFINMYSEVFPTTPGQIYEEVTKGTQEGSVSWGSKMNIFRPGEIKRINYGVGCHHADPEGNIILEKESEIKTLHMKFLSKEWVIERSQYAAGRLSELNKMKGWGYHYQLSPERISASFDEALTRIKKVI